ncbi:MAG: hypothetical protein ABIR87_08145 [Sphingomicrobium sp.]
MAAETNAQSGNEPHIRTHTNDYAKFITVLKWSVIVIAIIAAVVIYIIGN